MDLSIIGSVTSVWFTALFADVGHNVVCVDNDARKIEALQLARCPSMNPVSKKYHRNVSRIGAF